MSAELMLTGSAFAALAHPLCAPPLTFCAKMSAAEVLTTVVTTPVVQGAFRAMLLYARPTLITGANTVVAMRLSAPIASKARGLCEQ